LQVGGPSLCEGCVDRDGRRIRRHDVWGAAVAANRIAAREVYASPIACHSVRLACPKVQGKGGPGILAGQNDVRGLRVEDIRSAIDRPRRGIAAARTSPENENLRQSQYAQNL
jgi:hypothetical protein